MKRRIYAIALVFIILFSGITPKRFTAAQESNIWIDLEIEKEYVFINEDIEITAKTNSPLIQITIIDPEGTQLYNRIWNANETRKLPTSTDNKAGTYTIKAKAGNSEITKWITLIKETGYSPASFPISKTIHENRITVFGNWTVKVYNEYLGTSWIDIIALRNIVQEY